MRVEVADFLTTTATTLVWTVQVYAALGLIFAIPFALRGVDRVDPAAHGASWGFRVLIVPGAVAFWPLLLRRWWSGAPKPVERTAHRDAAEGGR